MEFITSVGAKTVKMLVLSNIFRAGHPQNKMGARELNTLSEQNVTTEKNKPVLQENLSSHSSFRTKLRTKTHDHINEMDDTKTVRREKCLSNSVDNIVTHNDAKSKVICSAKGLLETNLDDLFNENVQDWTETKSFGASEPVLSFRDSAKRGSLMSEDDSDEDTATDSDCLDEVVREQRKCMGARRIGHLLRRVISRNGEFYRLWFKYIILDSDSIISLQIQAHRYSLSLKNIFGVF